MKILIRDKSHQLKVLSPCFPSVTGVRGFIEIDAGDKSNATDWANEVAKSFEPEPMLIPYLPSEMGSGFRRVKNTEGLTIQKLRSLNKGTKKPSYRWMLFMHPPGKCKYNFSVNTNMCLSLF